LVPSKPNFINQIDHSCCNDYYALWWSVHVT
jgi:hypothetical protein